MTKRIHIQNQRTKNGTQDLSTTSALGMVQAQKATQVQQTDLKTSLIKTEKYGHHLNKNNLANQPVSTALQPKLYNQPVQLTTGQKRPANSSAGVSPPQKQQRHTISSMASSVTSSVRSRLPKNPALADSSIKNEIKNASGKGNQRTFNHLQNVANSPIGALKQQEFLSSVSPSNPNAKHNIAKIETTSRDKTVKRENELWGHGMNEPAGTRNIIRYTQQSAGLHPGINPTSSFTNGTRFNYLDIHEGLRTDTAKTFFPDGTAHAGAVKLDPKKTAFHSGGNSQYDKAMDTAQENTMTPAKRLRHLTAGHLNATAKPDLILDPKGPFTQGTTVTGDDLSNPHGKQNTAKIVGEQRNRLKKLKIKTDGLMDMTNEPKGGTPTISPIDKRFPVSSPTTPIATNPQLWKDYINK